MFSYLKKVLPGFALCVLITVPCFFLGKLLPVVGGAVFAIISGIVCALFLKKFKIFDAGIKLCSKYILQLAVIILGFKLNLSSILSNGKEALPIILLTIAVSLFTSFVLAKLLKLDRNTATLVGVGSSICGGSAIAATSPVIKASDDEIAQSISVIFLFNIIAALIFPHLGNLLHLSNHGFAIFAGTAVNDTSSVVAAASSWEGMHNVSGVVDEAAVVKLTRTLAIIPITLVLAFIEMRKCKKLDKERSREDKLNFKFSKIFPWFILFFLLASVITTIFKLDTISVAKNTFSILSELLIICAMSAIGLKTDIVKLVKTGGKPILLGFTCWIMIIGSSLLMQFLLHLW